MHHRFAAHELLQLHELLTNEVLSAQKSQIIGSSVTDHDVWNFIQKCNSKKQKRIQECQALIGHDFQNTYNSYGSSVSGQNSGYNYGAYGGYTYETDKKH